MGPICWVLSSEIFPIRLRAQASALGQVGGRVGSGLVSMSFLSMARAISVGGMFFVFAAISTVSVVFVYFCVPETKGKTLEQIEIMFEGGKEWKGGGEVELEDTQHLIQGDKKSFSLGWYNQQSNMKLHVSAETASSCFRHQIEKWWSCLQLLPILRAQQDFTAHRL